MSLALYGCHVPYPVTAGLLPRGVDVLTAQMDHTTTLPDAQLLDRATTLGRILVTQDEDLLAEAAFRQREGGHFAGLIFARQQSITVGKFIEDLELLARVIEPDDMANHVEFLPL